MFFSGGIYTYHIYSNCGTGVLLFFTLDIGGHSELWVKDGDNYNTFAMVVIMTKHIVGHVLKAVTYHHLLLKICICDTIWGCATIKINYKNKVICTWIVTHWATIWICATNQVNTVFY